MELEERKKEILSVVIDQFIKTGEPVGSKAVMDKLQVSVSSATIRNEMAVLEDMGLLYQPHTSAGRVPSSKGYKIFVDKIMKSYELTEIEKQEIDMLLSSLNKSIKDISRQTAHIISEMTGCAAVAIAPAAGGTLQLFEAFVAGKHLLAVLAVSETGVTKTKMCITDIEPDKNSTLVLSKILSATFSGKTASQISKEMLKLAEAEINNNCPEFLSIMPYIEEFIKELCDYDVYVGGEERLFNFPEFTNNDKIKPFLALLSKHDRLRELAKLNPSNIEVDVFSSGELAQIDDISMITSGMYMGSDSGIMCVFGPTRLDYARLLSKMNYFTDEMTKIIDELYKEDKG